MNWLHDVMTEVASHPVSDEVKTTLLVSTTDLSEICDRFVPKAPAPAVGFDVETGELRVGWEREDKSLWLYLSDDACTLDLDLSHGMRHQIVSLSDDACALDLDLSHGMRHQIVSSPNYATLKSAVRSFFDKWAA